MKVKIIKKFYEYYKEKLSIDIIIDEKLHDKLLIKIYEENDIIITNDKLKINLLNQAIDKGYADILEE